MMSAIQTSSTGVRTRKRTQTQRQPPVGITFDEEDHHQHQQQRGGGGYATPIQQSFSKKRNNFSSSSDNNNNSLTKIALEPKARPSRKKPTSLNSVSIKNENDENNNINSCNDATTTTATSTSTPAEQPKINTVTPVGGESGHVTSSSTETSPVVKSDPAVAVDDKHVRFNNKHRDYSPQQIKQEVEEKKGSSSTSETDISRRQTNSQSSTADAPVDSPSSRGSRDVSRRGRGSGFRGYTAGITSSPINSSSSNVPPPPPPTTYNSPNKKQRTDSSLAENDSVVVPSLVSAKSSDLGSPAGNSTSNKTSSSSSGIKKEEDTGRVGDLLEAAAASRQGARINQNQKQQQQQVMMAGGQKRKPYSITCDPSNIVASPLASNEGDSPSSAGANNNTTTTSAMAPPAAASSLPPPPPTKKDSSSRFNYNSDKNNRPTTPAGISENKRSFETTTGRQQHSGATAGRGSRNVTFSPPPPSSHYYADGPRRTPMRSPTGGGGGGGGGQFHNLPSLQDAKLQSPCGLFLSPYSPSAAAYQAIADASSFDGGDGGGSGSGGGGGKRANGTTEEEKSSKTRDEERARAVSTPTDFSLDFGKGHQLSASFDASNVLAWLQSPTANGLFSPGGITSSAVNTPRGAYGVPRTPRTPTLSSSFFFSDVASLPRNGEFVSPRPSPKQAPGGSGGPKRGGPGGSSQKNMAGFSISPLSSKRNNGVGRGIESQTNTPLNYKDIFASPRLPIGSAGRRGPRSLPHLTDSPTKSSSTKGGSSVQRGTSASLDAVHMAERDLMEDEDLSVLLQLASHSNTPVKSAGGSRVFRSPLARKSDQARHPYQDSANLQLPVIGDGEGSKAKLSRKTAYSGDHSDAHQDFAPPASLSIRSSSSSGSKEIYLGGPKNDSPQNRRGRASHENASPYRPAHPGSRKSTKKPISTHPSAYAMPPGSHPPYPPHHGPGSDPVTYYPMPGTMPSMPPGGSMRVVVGGPPPIGRPGSNGSSPPRPNHSSPHRPPPPYGMPSHHPPPGSYPHRAYPPPHHGPPPHMGVPPPHYGHYPPHPGHQRHLYPSQHPPPPPPKSHKGKQPKPPKTTTKRPSPDIHKSALNLAIKKPKKSPPKTGEKKPRKPKTHSPPLNDPADRQKAAATIATINDASGGKNNKAASLAAAILRGVTMRPSGKWQAQLYYAGKSRYIGVFDTREKAALAYEIARERLKSEDKRPSDQSAQSLKATEANVNAARKAAFDGVNEKDPRMSGHK